MDRRAAIADELGALAKDLEEATGSSVGILLVRHIDQNSEVDLALPANGHSLETMALSLLTAARQIAGTGAAEGCPDCIARLGRVQAALAALDTAGQVHVRTGEETAH